MVIGPWKNGKMGRCPMYQGFMVGFGSERRTHETMNPSCQQDNIVQTDWDSMLICGMFAWHGLSSLVLLSTLLIVDGYAELLVVIDCTFWHNDGKFQHDNVLCHWNRSCLKLVRRAFWTVLTNGEVTLFAQYEPNWALMERDKDVQFHPRSCIYKYVDTYKYQVPVGDYVAGGISSTCIIGGCLTGWYTSSGYILTICKCKFKI